MRKYTVNRDDEPKIPSKETIGKYKNFSNLTHEYDKLTKRPKVPIYKDKKMFLVLLLIVLVAFILSQVPEEKESVEDGHEDPSKSEQIDSLDAY